MEILLDTHALIWFINGDNQLSENAKKLIKTTQNKCFISIASIWEIAIKMSIGKLEISNGFDDLSKILIQNDIEILPISVSHIQQLLSLEYEHRDPFDRMIIAQAIAEKIPVITKDENFLKYDVEVK
jgi:PIN domain nuclease of toxin-antitoxin system